MTGKRRKGVIATTAVAVAVVVATLSLWAVASRARTPAQRAQEAAPPPASELTAIVEHGPLSDGFTLDGKLGRQSRSSVQGPPVSSGRSVVTDLPIKRGSQVRNRQLVAVVSGRPLMVLEGKFASYRDLRLGDKGPDVRQLRLALGLAGEETYDRTTAASVARLYKEVGYPAPAAAATVPGGLLPMNEVAFLPTLPATVVEVTAKVGDKGDQPLLTLASGAWQVVALLTEDERAGLTGLPKGAHMSISEGQGAGTAVTLAGIKPINSAEQDQTRYEATFTMDASLDGKGLTEGGPVSIRAIRRTSPDEAVVIPVSALWTKPGGQVEVRVQSAAGKTTVPVTVLFIVDGRAAVTGPAALAPGVRVLIGSRNGGSIE